MNNSICIFLHLQCDTGPSHMCRHCKILSPNSSKASTECRLGQASTVLEEKCGKILHCNQRRKKNPISKTSDVMSECRSNMDLAEQLLASLFPTNTILPSSVILPLMPLLCITVQSHGHISAIIIISHYCMTIPHQSL